MAPPPTTQPGQMDKQLQQIQALPGKEYYASNPLQCRLTEFYLDGAELMRVSLLWFSEAVGQLVQEIEPPNTVIDIHKFWDVFSSILSLIKAYGKS
ncbi:hypothetical protein VP01_1684g2 [Puccinia sorghi]|uniref:Uncharacterized protein n=1 Tax=Puccinia sorghi TaxID=27349 RepID=A0A0L6VFV3_9BASI|nr:hypothetical protein VP01_1684g2 [Puccinia sorghi]